MITIDLVSERQDKKWVLSQITREILKINDNEFSIKLIDKPIGKADIVYWVHCGSIDYDLVRTLKGNKVCPKLVAQFYNPKNYWDKAMAILDHCIFSAKRLTMFLV